MAESRGWILRRGECSVWAANHFRKFSERASYVLWAAPFSSSSTSKHSTLSSVSLCLFPTVCSITRCNVLQTDLTAWVCTIKYLLLEYCLLRDHKLGGLSRSVKRKTLKRTEGERAGETTETCKIRFYPDLKKYHSFYEETRISHHRLSLIYVGS